MGIIDICELHSDPDRARDVPISGCPVCAAPAPQRFISVEQLDYWRCDVCEARFLEPRQHPSRDVEYAHYLHHENHPDDPRYRRFLSKLAGPLLTRLPAGSRGLDYGCGPGPALAAMLREAGHDVALYDPFFHPNQEPLEWVNDFVTCTETVEHFHRPAEEFDRLAGLVRHGGGLAIMTRFQTDDGRFANWHYRKDPTHVVLYRGETMRHLAASRDWTCAIPVMDVALMQKPQEGCTAA
jgi:SAM-dependent methyltransferase